MTQNPYLLAADNPQGLLALLREDPTIASDQDENGYSLVHAAASYDHLDLLRALVRDFNVPVDLKDEDGETALFVVETPVAARVLVEELGLDVKIKNNEGQTAMEKIEVEGDFPAVAGYLRSRVSADTNGMLNGHEVSVPSDLPPAPEGLHVTFGSIDEHDSTVQEPDSEIRRRIEELASREDFQTSEGQAELRRLIQDAVSGQELSEDRNVRPRRD